MPLRLATFNLLDFFDPSCPEEAGLVEDKLQNIAAILRRADADVVALQEVGSEALLGRLTGLALADMGYRSTTLAAPDRRGIRNAIVSRLPVLEARVHAASSLPFPRMVDGDPPPFDGRIPLRRGVVHVRVDAGALGPVDVLTLHFKSKLGAPMKTSEGVDIDDPSPRGRAEAELRSLVQRSAEALFVRGAVDELLREPDRQVCVMGDFNDGLYELPVRIVRGAMRDVDPGLVLTGAADRVPPDRRFSVMHGGRRDLIDHILCSASLAARLGGAAILNEALRDHGPPMPDAPPAPDSDHALVVAWFGD
jgi:endonuclease/exonuclease/phosphatase family metal-dependent hydrolase